MDVFITSLITLFVMTAIFYIVIFSFIYYWHLKKITFIVLPLVFAFEFFVMGFFTISIVTIIIKYLPELIRAAGL